MKQGRTKPQGASGPIKTGQDGAEWAVIPFPEDKAEREEMIARLFVKGFEIYVQMQSEPSWAPFGKPKQNLENDIDFTVMTSQGEKLMELAEFAPLKSHGGTFANAPKKIDPKEKTELALSLIQEKSAHQGGKDRFLVIYATEQGFRIDPMTVERLRRILAIYPPNFERIYSASPIDLEYAAVSEIYPGKPHHFWGSEPIDVLDQWNTYQPHPTEFTVGFSRTWSWPVTIVYGQHRIVVEATVSISGSGLFGVTRTVFGGS
ncbi:MAG: hypothetical protein E5Y74_24320 [Mesorhizobium sp.]|uniref:hypothetical protein n=1 Tax=unclassified Mesorhizobium TaxID=325217 RepID=UPI000FD92B1E|nr:MULTISPECIES: hypothetical protein [unclassified Mesorhizobium]AZV21996.1 hypothetical protein EJ079_24710 [Mesorhizobium sp. M7A.F.Ce.TU.012.03.2.1]RWQ12934.1 MAG: hypothetical protein EOR93_32640 [Mesorhizobium sp.]TIM18973.1 MAG: hypothetical protein E5Y74_24320 [Mesorhizobium sp.]TIN67696.1 MAG: hypothetical protein E5Y30_26700 [Mesorhizobium sp.]